MLETKTSQIDTQRFAESLNGAEDRLSFLRDAMLERYNRLIAQSSVKKVGGSSSVDDFIAPTVPIVSEGELSKEFFIDDPELYDGLAERVVELIDKIRQQQPDLEDAMTYYAAVIYAVQKAQISYFNNTVSGNKHLRAKMLGDFIGSEYPESYSIKDLKGVAKCMERAVVSHNMLKLLGIPCTLEVGELITENGESGGHAWVTFIDYSGQKRIFDPLNCHIVKADGGAVIDIKPLLGRVNDNEDEPPFIIQNTYDTRGNVVEQHRLTYIFPSTESLQFSKQYLGR